MYRKRKSKSALSMALSLILALGLVLSLFSYRAYAQGVGYSIKVRQFITINGAYSKPKDRFTYVIEGVSPQAPLPQNQRERYEFDLIGDQERWLGFSFDKPGDYVYRLYQKKDDKRDYLTQDGEEYQIIIRVTEADGVLVASLYMVVDSGFHKVEELDFTNRYTIPDKPQDKGEDRPDDKPGDKDSSDPGPADKKPGTKVDKKEVGQVRKDQAKKDRGTSTRKPKTSDEINLSLILGFPLVALALVGLFASRKRTDEKKNK